MIANTKMTQVLKFSGKDFKVAVIKNILMSNTLETNLNYQKPQQKRKGKRKT